jgi:hypothetical protein
VPINNVSNDATFSSGVNRSCTLLGIVLSLAACNSVSLSPQASTTLSRHETKESGACNFPAVFADRSFVAIIPGLPESPDPDGAIFAGYWTRFAPGSPPFACDRLYYSGRQGVFRFGVYQLPAEAKRSFRSARLEVLDFSPIEISVRWGQPWSVPFGSAVLGSADPPPPRDTCWFRVSTATQNWAPGVLGWLKPAIVSRDLAQGEQRFEMPTERLRQIHVGPEVRAWLNGEQEEFGFTIDAADAGMDSKAASTCVGMFKFRLIVNY